ncbi:hypothetical protein B0H14DRAFT_3667005 [Mycena olivaceomarginata]|nr:hypothetical protein B0H14DRAFT_3667005 [Mycena olivaceomarginata]
MARPHSRKSEQVENAPDVHPRVQVETKDYNDPHCEPEPIDAGLGALSTSALAALAHANEYLRLELKELQILLAQQLLAITNDNFALVVVVRDPAIVATIKDTLACGQPYFAALDTIPTPLLGRIEVLIVSGYVSDEKLEIASEDLDEDVLARVHTGRGRFHCHYAPDTTPTSATSDTLLSTAATDTLDLPKTPQGPAVSEAAAKPVMTTRRPPCWCMRVRMYGGISKGGAKGRMPLPGVSMGLGYLGNGSGANESFSSACGKHRAVLPPRALPTGAHHQILILGPALRNGVLLLRLGLVWPYRTPKHHRRHAHHTESHTANVMRICVWDAPGRPAPESVVNGGRIT